MGKDHAEGTLESLLKTVGDAVTGPIGKQCNRWKLLRSPAVEHGGTNLMVARTPRRPTTLHRQLFVLKTHLHQSW